MENQEQLWDKIAPEWHKHKKIPAHNTVTFLKKQKGNVLDLGSGSGRNMMKINGKMFLTDFSKDMLKLAEQKAKKEKIQIETKQSNLWEIPYEDNFFDAAICVSALHCIEKKKHRKKSVKDLYRVLKPGATAYIGVWNVNSKRFSKKKKKELLVGWTDKGKRFYYLYDEKEVHKLFKKAKFKIISTHNSEMMINFIVKKE